MRFTGFRPIPAATSDLYIESLISVFDQIDDARERGIFSKTKDHRAEQNGSGCDRPKKEGAPPI